MCSKCCYLLLFVVIPFPGREDAGHHAPDAASPDPLDGVHAAERDVRRALHQPLLLGVQAGPGSDPQHHYYYTKYL